MWKIQTPPLDKVVYIWNVDFFDFGIDPPPPYGLFPQIQNSPHYPRGGGQENYRLFPQFVTFFLWMLPLAKVDQSAQ